MITNRYLLSPSCKSAYYPTLLAIPALLTGTAHADVKVVSIVQVKLPNPQKTSKEYQALMNQMASTSPELALATGTPLTSTHYQQGSRDRYDFGSITVIEDAVSDQYITVYRALRVYSVRPLHPIKKIISPPGYGEVDNIIVSDKHETKEIAGQTASHYVLREKGASASENSIQVWMGKSLPRTRFMPPVGVGTLDVFDKLIGNLPGQCLEMSASTSSAFGDSTISHRVTEFSAQPVAASMFTVPPGFKEIAWSRSMMEKDRDDADTQLVDAADDGNLEQIKDSLKSGVDVNTTDDYGRTPLIAAVRHLANLNDNATETITLLLARGAKVNTPVPPYNTTPLMEAASAGDAAIIKLLLAYGAATKLKDKNGKTALDHATDQHQVDVIKLLAAAGKL